MASTLGAADPGRAPMTPRSFAVGLALLSVLASRIGWHTPALLLLGAALFVLIRDADLRIERLQTRLAALERPAAPPPAKAVTTPVAAATPAAPEPAVEAAARPAAAATPPPADEASLAVTQSLAASLRAWLSGGNAIVRVALLLMLIGVAFLLRLASQHLVLPLPWRIAAVALGGVALAALGWRLRRRRRGYALSLQGGGIGIVYLCVFSAYRLYELVPASLAFAWLCVLAALTAWLAVRQDALPLALFGFGGAFLAPVLAGRDGGHPAGLFGYQLLLNLAIAWIARRQAWKLLNLTGALMTFGIATAWGVSAYSPQHRLTCQVFLLLHLLLYIDIALQYARRLAEAREHGAPAWPVVDAGLLFGVPLAAFGLQAAMLHDQRLALAASAAALSGLYLVLARWLWRRAGARLHGLSEALFVLGVVFLALVGPLALDLRWTGVAWALQGAGIVWIGLRQQRQIAAALGSVLQLAAALAFGADDLAAGTAWGEWLTTPPAGTGGGLPESLGRALLGAAAALSAHRWWPRVHDSALARAAHALLLGLALLQVWGAVWVPWRAADLSWSSLQRAIAWLAVLAGLLHGLHRTLRWSALALCGRGLWLLALGLAALDGLAALPSSARAWRHLVEQGGGLVGLGLVLIGAWLQRRSGPALRPAEPVLLAGFTLAGAASAAHTWAGHALPRAEAWSTAVLVAAPSALALGLVRIGQRVPPRWPMNPHAAALRRAVLQPLLGLAGLWVLVVNAVSAGAMDPLPYLPLLNPLDLAHALVALFALQLDRLAPLPRPLAPRLAAALAFWWVNGLLMRSLHHLTGTPLGWSAAWASPLLQTALSLLWTLCACGAMGLASRRGLRAVWVAGAALLSAVVLKLFLVDLSQAGTLERSVSFLGVGALMLLIGYVAPCPPCPR